MTDAARVAVAILLIASATVGAAWGFTAYNGPLSDEPIYDPEEEGVFLITYRLAEWTHATETREFGDQTEVTFEGIKVPLQNVTRVQVTLQVASTGPSINDAYDVRLRDPKGDERSGSHAVPSPQPEGYIRSANVFDWARTPQPGSESYRAEDPDDAAAWSAERRTDTSAKGEWEGVVTLNQPPIARNANASLFLRFTWYEAVVLPGSPSPAPSPPQNTTGNGTETLLFDALPRTFITSRSVDGDR